MWDKLCLKLSYIRTLDSKGVPFAPTRKWIDPVASSQTNKMA